MNLRQDNSDITVSPEKVLELLVFARDKIQDSLELESCPHGGWFATEDARCRQCAAQPECAWLLHNDGVLPWSERSDEDLHSALRFALELLGDAARGGEHDVQSCVCDACTWLRSARRCLAHRS